MDSELSVLEVKAAGIEAQEREARMALTGGGRGGVKGLKLYFDIFWMKVL